MAQTNKSMPINKPEYSGMQNRLRNYIRGKNENFKDTDGVCKPHNPCTEGWLTPDLHYLSQVSIREAI